MSYQSFNNPITVSYNPGTIDVFGTVTTAPRQLQINDQFTTGTLSNIINVVTSGGATGAIATGLASFSTSTATTASVTGNSLDNITYYPGSEIFAEFTAVFTTPTSANSNQKIGLYNSTNGFYIGFIGTSFGITVRNNSVDTTTAQASWNLDTLTGANNSLFTRNGVPEAIDFTKLNLFRIRFGWLGAASIFFEVASPDGAWITFHIIRQPNSSAIPSIQTPNLPMTVEVNKTSADATNLTLSCACWAAGAVQLPIGPVDGQKATYSATSAIAFGPPSLATDIFTITGSATKIVRVLRIGFSGTQTTSGNANVLLIKRSSANSGGTAVAATAVSHDSTDQPATATVLNYTANATSLGTAIGTVRAMRAFIPAPATATNTSYYEFDFGNLPEKCVVLRGTSQVLALNLNAVTLSGNLFTCFIEWTEE